MPMTLIQRSRAAILIVGLLIAALPVAADSVRLANGDLLNGRVLSLDDTQLRLESDTLGQINIPRAKVVSITLGDPVPAVSGTAPKAGNLPAASGPESVLKQLQVTGVNPKDVGDIQKMFPLLATPEASTYFNNTLKGLLGGSMSVGDIRKDAVRARDELKKATKGLGPDVEAAVAPYLTILEKFINETQPSPPPAKLRKVEPPVQKK
jgi:hypothetical protein